MGYSSHLTPVSAAGCGKRKIFISLFFVTHVMLRVRVQDPEIISRIRGGGPTSAAHVASTSWGYVLGDQVIINVRTAVKRRPAAHGG